MNSSVSEISSGKAFGIHRTIDQMGAITAPIAAFVLLQIMDIRGIFFVSLIPGAIAVLILIFFVKEVFIKRHNTMTKRPTIYANIGSVLKKRPFVILLIVTALFNLGAFNFSFVLLRASDLGVSEDLIPIVFAFINITHTLMGIPAGILADKIGKEKVLILGYMLFAVSSILMILLTGSYLYAYFIASVYGAYVGISETVQRVVVRRYISSELRGTAFGIYYVLLGASFFVSNVIFGYLWDNYNLSVAVAYCLFFAFSAILGMFVFVRKYPTNRAITP